MTTIVQGDYCKICDPIRGLTAKSVNLCPKNIHHIHFTDTAEKNFVGEMYQMLQKMVVLWKKQDISESFMVLGQDELQRSDKIFSFQAVPYYKTSSCIGKFWQQLVVLWRFTFGGISQHVHDLCNTYGNLLDQEVLATTKVDDVSKCAFCNQDVIHSQLVLKKKHVQVLYNYAPIGLGGEKLHFLVVPRVHRSSFTSLTPEEHQEAFKLSKLVVEQLQVHFEKIGRPLQKLYVYHKTGADAGQTVPHWHMHIVLIQNVAQDWLGRLTVLRNILCGPSKLSEAKLSEQRIKYFHILKKSL